MNKEEIEGQLKLSKKQNKNERYDYLCAQFNCVNYAINLEKYTNKLQQQNQKYKEVIDKAINSIDILQEIIYQQPTNNSADDLWLLDKLDGIKNILKEVE